MRRKLGRTMGLRQFVSGVFGAPLALLGALPVAAQDGPPEGSGPWSTELEAAGAVVGDTDLTGGGSFSVTRGIVASTLSYAPSRENSIGVSISAGTATYDFSGIPAIWGRIDEVNLSVPIRFGLGGATALVIPTLRYSGEEGVDAADGQTGGVIVGALWRVRDGLLLGPGLGAVTQLQGGLAYFPFLLIDWSITDRVKLSTGRGLGASRGPGLSLSYEVSEALSLGLAGRYEDVEFRLDGDGLAPGGIGRDRSLPLVATLDWKPAPGLSINAFAGMQFGGTLTLEDEDGHKIDQRDYDPAPILGATVDFRF